MRYTRGLDACAPVHQSTAPGTHGLRSATSSRSIIMPPDYPGRPMTYLDHCHQLAPFRSLASLLCSNLIDHAFDCRTFERFVSERSDKAGPRQVTNTTRLEHMFDHDGMGGYICHMSDSTGTAPRGGLTPRQRTILDVIRASVTTRG